MITEISKPTASFGIRKLECIGYCVADWRCSDDDTFSHFDRALAWDKHTDTLPVCQCMYRASIASRG